MAIETMRLVILSTKPDNVYQMIESVVDSTLLHPEESAKIINEGNGGLVYPNEKIYETFLNRCDRIIHDLDLTLDDSFDRNYSIEEIEDAITQAEDQYNTLHALETGVTLDEDDKYALKTLRQYDFDGLEGGFINLKFGRIPLDSYSKIVMHADETFVFTQLHKTKHYAWIAYIGLRQDEKSLDSLFDSLYFEPIAIPLYSEELLNQSCLNLLDHVYGYCKKRAQEEAFMKYIAVFEDQVTITGFVPKTQIENFKASIESPVTIKDFPADAESGLQAPTRLKNGWFAAPFELFIEMYGLPQYGGFDPTQFFAVTYALLFGLMFGDLGQGFVLVLGGAYLAKKKGMGLGKVAVRIGMFSMFFGLIFGSFFGNEEILKPLLNPIGLPIHVASPDFTMTLLLSAVALGSTLILSAILINIIQSIKHKDYSVALFSQNGLAGFILYGFVMVGMALTMMGDINIFKAWTLILCVIIPLICILFIEPLKHMLEKKALAPNAGWGSYLVEGIFELIEVVLSFVTNTMSFLRVGGFVLSHAGMMVVVMTLNDMAGQYGILVMILGNALVIALEGLIVGIQTLRLEYYEMFSRYYSGGGKRFETVYKEKLS